MKPAAKALGDEVIDKMVEAWFAINVENTVDYRARMRQAIAAIPAPAEAIPERVAILIAAMTTNDDPHARGQFGSELLRIFRSRAAPTEAAPAQAPAVRADDVRDAARYRWLRQEYQSVEGPAAYAPWGGEILFNDELDKAVDAALAASQPCRSHIEGMTMALAPRNIRLTYPWCEAAPLHLVDVRRDAPNGAASAVPWVGDL